jgi:hypothetical protein
MSLAIVTHINQSKKAMPSGNGFVILWRDINKQVWSGESLPYAVFTKLLTRVQHKAYITEVNGLQIPLQPGEYAMSWADVTALFKEIKDKSHARRLIKRFESLSQVYTREVKKGGVNYGFIIGFTGWEKWQNADTPTDTPRDTPRSADLKASEGGHDTPHDTPLDTQRNNNVLNKLKESDRQAYLKLIDSAYAHTWKRWKSCKASIDKVDTSPKGKTLTNNFKKIFTQAYIRKNGEAGFRSEINQLCKFIDKAHSIEGFSRFRNMGLAAFLNEKQWRD